MILGKSIFYLLKEDYRLAAVLVAAVGRLTRARTSRSAFRRTSNSPTLRNPGVR